MRPIDADALSALLFKMMGECETLANDLPKGSCAERVYYGKTTALYETQLAIQREMPTLDYAPARRGEWDCDDVYVWRCTLCKKWVMVEDQDGEMNFCPNCGANMMPLPEAPKEE